MRNLLAMLAATTFLTGAAQAATIYPLDRATILVNSPFDFKIELDEVHPEGDVAVTVNGKPYAEIFGKPAEFVAEEKGDDDAALGSALILRDLALAEPGRYTVEVKAGEESKSVTWEVYSTAETPKAKNVIFILGDGLSVAHRTAARIMSKGMTEGKANGRLAMDDLDHMAFIGTSSTHSIATDSANTMSAYMTGHKSRVNALGVYADRTPDSLDDPRVETIAEALRRTTNKAIGVVSTSELQDATPAAVVAHTRKRADKAEIVGMFHDIQPEVILGGGSAYFLKADIPGSKRKDDKDYIQLFKDAGYALATSRDELAAAAGSNAGKLLGLFHTGNMDTWLDRNQLKKGTVDKFPDQPGLVEMTQSALAQLSKNPDGFFLMVEGASIDKMSHPMDWDRAVVETIELDQVVALAREFAEANPDTLIVVTGDHTHGVSLIGTIDDNRPGDQMRQKVGVYDEAGFPDYADADGDGYPDSVDVARRFAIFASNYPDHYETWGPKLDGPFQPAVQNENGEYVANDAYKDLPGAVFREGNLPKDNDTAVHAVDDIVLQAAGPGAEAFKGYMEQSDVYKILADVFALGTVQK
ncbi:alkaline phosphatase [Paracoccus sp. P2]|uniref:Alkaline phosphatase n=1 Tax=Paracoccus pantotrophus TaxID=82367 RepID=A0A7H9BZQ1_PARPN|nr:alkaline phosphatase [Paracoccus pantotrophus]MDF3854184.1 alkaline phosphatase [Paracoccus pantotrophus]QLH16870.1 alkaline phosphatase [Paracoccus pantotrophus]RDD98725.1 alkaline phosphatase [Paracoccus pantotrophus]RNI14979.1 alkaline phosphatase [Paracoccus pantotrophus]WGR65930.1 alkaline phosphatase [Paracoccus pantotrophus]